MSPTKSVAGREQSPEMNTPIPQAIREDHDPFKLLTGIGAGSLFAFLRWSDFRCPFCRENFRRSYLPNEVRLGRGERVCASCRQSFDDGSREWPKLTQRERIRYVLPTPIMGVVGGLLVCILIALFAALQPTTGVNWNFLEIVVAGFAFLMIGWTVLRFPGIRRSVRRYAVERGESPAFGTKGK